MLQLVTDMSPERLSQVYEALPEALIRALDVPIGAALNSRPTSVARRPLGLRIKALRAYLLRKRDDGLAGDVVRTYLLGPRKQLVTDFLDAVGLAHEDGQLSEDEASPDESKVADAVIAVLANHEREDLKLYLGVAALQWPDNKAIADALQGLSG